MNSVSRIGLQFTKQPAAFLLNINTTKVYSNTSFVAIRHFSAIPQFPLLTTNDLTDRIKLAQDISKNLEALDSHPKLKNSEYCLHSAAIATIKLNEWILGCQIDNTLDYLNNNHNYNEALWNISAWWRGGTRELNSKSIELTEEQKITIDTIKSLVENAHHVAKLQYKE